MEDLVVDVRDNIKMDINEVKWEGMDCTDLPQDRDK